MDYTYIRDYYDDCATRDAWFEKIDYASVEDAIKLYRVFGDSLDLSRHFNCELLDFGCGTGHFYGYLRGLLPGCTASVDVGYTGLDISANMIEAASHYWTDAEFVLRDVLAEGLDDKYDYVVANGPFCWKGQLSHAEMLDFVREALHVLWENTWVSLSFNVMDGNKIVELDRSSDYFYLTYDQCVDVLLRPLGVTGWRWRADYGANDYTVTIFK